MQVFLKKCRKLKVQKIVQLVTHVFRKGA
ncbi:hypothetical protein DESHY_60148 [Desulforamulus hydrothermalis Lam5 = DSM 18033]|uniref:Transposase n=1 Tax=Desulforamulus hydrothermalis Lam5 = DSM 18033 TaxID=1121428 RepID=K8EK97_9FIRM|nr:hypothetical protein DESHY_60148 [Desulforamulus hydrothermalis Lam5 = DSM 18033]